MLKNKIIILLLPFLFFYCTESLSFEGRISNINSSSSLSSAPSSKLKSVTSITLLNKSGEEVIFIVNPEKTLEDINLEFSYSHVKLHMESGEKVIIE